MLGVLSGNRTHIKDTSVGERTTLGLCPSVLSLRGYYTGNNNGKIYVMHLKPTGNWETGSQTIGLCHKLTFVCDFW